MTAALVLAVTIVMLLSLLSGAGLGKVAGPSGGSAGPLAPITASPSASKISHPAALPVAPSPAKSIVAPHFGGMGQFKIPGPHPPSWGQTGLPPGGEAALPQHTAPSASSSSQSWLNRFCAGLWPGGPTDWAQYYYEGNCYGHDEPGINFYSNQPGSGGNVSWNVTLPVDRSPTHNQSSLYSAIWFGMTLSDPLGWLGQCFLELQFYPDQTWYNPGPLYPNATVNGAWIAAAVAWQIESATGFEDPCFYEPAYSNGVPGPAFLNMTQGDHIQVTMSGWQNSPTGETIVILDLTNGQKSSFVLFDATGGYPLNPAYSTSSYPNSLQWTPGGEYPVSFAFETGHAGNPDWPANNTYGGCSGGPKSTPVDPGAPCPSYDPGQWANNTLHPWHFSVPTFWNAKDTTRPTQVAFTQPEGGIDLVDQTSNGVCAGSEGSAWCTYPWYSYYCNAHAFEFGALDYAGVTADFGKFTQYSTVGIADQSGIGFFGPTNFSIPTCGSPSYHVTLGTSGGAGSVYFLSHDYTSTMTVGGLGRGSFSLSAITTAGGSFGSWATTGGTSVTDPFSPWTTLTVHGSGTVTAVFSSTPAMTTVKFSDNPGGSIGVNPTPFFSGTGTGLATVANGGTLSLAAGLYPIEAYPKVGYEFTYWTASSNGLTIAAAQFPVTWLLVDGSASTAKLVAHYKASVDTATMYLVVQGVGSATLGSLTVTNTVPGTQVYNVALFNVGSYPLIVTTGTGSQAPIIEYFFPVIAMMNFSSHTRVTLENGTSEFLIVFNALATVTLVANTSTSGSVEVGTATGFESVASGSTLSLAAGTYAFAAAPARHDSFSGWATNNAANAVFFTSPSVVYVLITLDGTSTVYADFTPMVGTDKVTLADTPLSGGMIALNFGAPHANGGFVNVAGGQYYASAANPVGWVFSSWSTSGSVSLLLTGPGAAVITVTGAGTLTANFVPATFLVSFVASDGSAQISTAWVTIASATLFTGETTVLTYGMHTLTLHTGPGRTVTWSSTANIALPAGSHARTISFFVSGAGTIYAAMT
ncbi:MAG: hypothetical protein L3K10_08060 [Thermoplasmata archaeon]|nr:hypothetical protein [Thermoplasmata archaeon]